MGNYELTWCWRSLPLNKRTGSEVFELLFQSTSFISTLLESPFPTPTDRPQLSRYSLCAGFPRYSNRQIRLWTPSLGKIGSFLRSLLRQKPVYNAEVEHLPFTGGWLGWLGYDFAREIEKLPYLKSDSLPFPIAYWYEPDSFAVLDHQAQVLWLAARDSQELDRLQNILELKELNRTTPLSDSLQLLSDYPLSFLTDRADYEKAVRLGKKYIQAGDIFQTNLSLRFQTTTNTDSWSIYRTLQQINPSPFASYWQTPWGAVISCSPERLVQLQGNIAQTRPIAGTRTRGIDLQHDRQLSAELMTNLKERAEHIMLVDLERNDLGKVCQWGSIEVDELLTIERYSHVMHLVSNIKGQLQSDVSAVDLITSMFPGGTITGCPKVRCMEIIEELEPVRRNLFYGSGGYLDQRGNLDLNIFIRTLLYTTQPSQRSFSPQAIVYGQVGAGIVADSDPEKEWYESLHKAEAQLAALHLAKPYLQ